MQLTRFQTSDREEWQRALRRFAPHDDIYFQPEYARACEAGGAGEAECLLVSEGSSALLLPVLKCPVPGSSGLWDVQSPYGYGGPLVAGGDAGFIARAWRLIGESWEQAGGVAAFLRGHPLIGNETSFGPDWEVAYDRNTVSVDLRAGVAAAFAHPRAGKHRRDTALARRAGAHVHFQPLDAAGLVRFRALYLQTMARLGAGAEYFFAEAYFETLAGQFGDAMSLVEARDSVGGDPLSMALVFWGTHWAHYHLSARQPQGGNASHLLLQAVAEHAAERGLAGLHLGGGRTAVPEDSLLQFKRWVGNSVHRFHTARLVVNRRCYNDLVAAWRVEHPDSEPNWFLTYRQRPSATPSPLTKTS